jgi:hypothetical protein
MCHLTLVISLHVSFDPGGKKATYSREKLANVPKKIMDSQLLSVLPEMLNRSFQSPQPQHVTHGKYTISTTEASGPSPYYFHVTVASDEMSVEFSVWDSDIRFQEPVSRPVISRTNMTIGGKKELFVPDYKKYDSIRKEVADITSCLKLAWVYHL